MRFTPTADDSSLRGQMTIVESKEANPPKYKDGKGQG